MARVHALRGLPTPLHLAQTRGGGVPFLTPELVAQVPGLPAVAVPFADLMAMTVTPAEPLAAFFGLEVPALLLSRDFSHSDVTGSNNDKHCALETAQGRRLVTPADYEAAVRRLRPELAAALADVVDASASAKRHRTAVTRTLKWLDSNLGGLGADGADAASGLLGVVVGGADPELRRYCAEQVAERSGGLAGVVLGGFGRSDARADRPALLAASIAPLPAELPRVLVGVGQPLEVLDAVAAGVDAFSSSYSLALTEAGFASAFAVPGVDAPDIGRELAPGDGLKLNVRDRRLREDARPLVPGCPCFACREHSRAYVFHLFDCSEITGYALLHVHNETRQQLFFQAMREAIAEGRFEEFRAGVEDSCR